MKRKPPTVEITGATPQLPTNVEMAADELDDCLSPKRLAFITEFLIDHNGRQAAIRAGYSEATAQEQSSRLLSNVKVRAVLDRRMAAAADAAQVNAELVISELYQVAMCDPRDLMSVHRGACRFCWGLDHDRQWTQGEYRDAWHEARAADPTPPRRQCAEAWATTSRGSRTLNAPSAGAWESSASP